MTTLAYRKEYHRGGNIPVHCGCRFRLTLYPSGCRSVNPADDFSRKVSIVGILTLISRNIGIDNETGGIRMDKIYLK